MMPPVLNACGVTARLLRFVSRPCWQAIRQFGLVRAGARCFGWSGAWLHSSLHLQSALHRPCRHSSLNTEKKRDEMAPFNTT